MNMKLDHSFLIVQAADTPRRLEDAASLSSAQRVRAEVKQKIHFDTLLQPYYEITKLHEYSQIEVLDKKIDEKYAANAPKEEILALEKKRADLAKKALEKIDRLELKNHADRNMKNVYQAVKSQFTQKGEILASDLVHPLYWQADFNVLAVLLMRNVKMGEQQAKIETHGKYDALFKGKAALAVLEDKFVNFIDQLRKNRFNDGQNEYWIKENKLYQGKGSTEKVDGVYHFLVLELYDKHLKARDGLSPKEYLKQKTEEMTDPDRRYLLAYYLLAVAEYARVNTALFALENKYHVYYSSARKDNRKHVDLAYEVMTSLASRIFVNAREQAGKLDPEFNAIVQVIKHLDDGDRLLRGKNFSRAREEFERAQNANSGRLDAKDENDHLTQLIEERMRYLEDLAWIKGLSEKLTGEENPDRNPKDQGIIFDPKKTYADQAFFQKVILALRDPELPESKKTQLKQQLGEILKREKNYLSHKDDVKSEVYRDKERRELRVTPRAKAKLELNDLLVDLRSQLDSLSTYKEQQKEREGYIKSISEAEHFVNSYDNQKNKLKEEAIVEKKTQAKALKTKLESIPAAMLEEVDQAQKTERIKKKLDAISKLGNVQTDNLGKDIYKTFLNLQEALLEYRRNPSIDNLKRIAKYYVPLVMLFSLESETKDSLELVFRKNQVDSESFWQNAVYDPSGQNIFLDEYRKLKNNDGKNYLVEGFVGLSSYDLTVIENTPTTYYSFYDLKVAFGQTDVLGQMEKKHKENVSRLEEVSWFLKDVTGCIAAYDEVKSTRDINHMIFTFGRLLEKDQDLISMTQFTQQMKTLLEKNQIMVRYAPGGLAFQPESRTFSDPKINARFDKQGYGNVRQTGSVALLVTAYLLAYDLDFKVSINHFESDFKNYYGDATEQNANRFLFSASLKRPYPAEQRKKVLLQKLDQLEKYIKASSDGSEEEGYFKEIRLVIIQALRNSLK